MNRYPRQHALRQMDDSGLQTDVMRFMAIVAFCLVAILAVVRNVDAPPHQVSEQPVVTSPSPAPTSAVAMGPTPVPQVIAKQPEPQPLPEPEPQPEPEPMLPTPPPPKAVTTKEPTVQTPPRVSAEPTDSEPGLRLSFASNRDFLRLINAGAVTVYALQDTRFLALNTAYRFVDSPAPGTFHELDASTMPGLIKTTLSEHVSSVHEWRWGVVLPASISRQIQQQVSRHESGELKIDQYQRVHYVAGQ